MIDTKENILAVGRLFEFCSNKRFHLLENKFITDNIGKKALELNNSIKFNKGIDVFEATNEKDLIEYESTLSKYITEFSKELSRFKTIGDEIELYDMAIPYSKEKMSSFTYDLAPRIKEHLKKYTLSILDINSICKNPDSVIYIHKFRSFFVAKKLKIKYKERVILLHLMDAGDDSIQKSAFRRSDGTLVLQSGSLIEKDNSIHNLTVRMFMLFSANISDSFLLNPVKLFIRGLDDYAAETTMNHITKYFHYNVILPPHLDSPEKFYTVPAKHKKHSIRTTYAVQPSLISTTVLFLYGVDMDKMLNEFVKGKI